MTARAPQIIQRLAGSEDNCVLGITALPTGVLLTGTPTVEETSGDLTLTNPRVNTSNVTADGETYSAGTAVTFHRAGGVAGTDYTIKVTVSTDAATADIIVTECLLQILP